MTPRRPRRSTFAACALSLAAARGGVACIDDPAAAPSRPPLPFVPPPAPPADDAGADVSAEAEAAPPAPFCASRDAAICIDFPRTAAQGWESVENPTVGELAWSTLGATEPGSAAVTAPAIDGAEYYGGLSVRRYLNGLSGTRLRFESAVRFEAVPEIGFTTTFKLLVGNALFYIGLAQTGYYVEDGYYETSCGAGPCGGSRHFGQRLPIPLDTWDRLVLTLEPASEGRYLVSLTSASGDTVAFSTTPEFVFFLSYPAQLNLGMPVFSGSGTQRKAYFDDVLVSASP